jgi:hypothetical protein
MRFRIDRSPLGIPNSVLIYRPEEYSFDVDPALDNSFTSVLLGDLNLEIDAGGRVISVWGMCPYLRWVQNKLAPPDAAFGQLYFVPDAPLLPGVSIQLNRSAHTHLSIQFDKESGWVRIAGPGAPFSSVKLLPGIIFELTKQGQLYALWLKPRGALGTPEDQADVRRTPA